MPALNTDKIIAPGNPGTATSLAAPGYTVGGTSITVGSTSNWGTSTGQIFAMDEVETVNGVQVRVDGTYNEYVGTVASGTSITNVSHISGSGTDRNYSAGATTRVYVPVSSNHLNKLHEALTEEHNQDGTHGTITTDTINEHTAATGVTVDGLLIKDSKLATNNSVVTANITDANVTNAKLATGAGEPGGAWDVWTPTLTGWSSNPTGGLYYYKQVGKMVTLSIVQPNNGTSNATTCEFTLPVNAVTRTNAGWSAPAEIVDNGVTKTSPGLAGVISGGTKVVVALDYGYNAFTTSGNKRVIRCVITYEAA